VLRNLSNRKERSDGAGSFLRLGQSSSVEEVLEDFAKIAAEKGIRLFSVRFKRDRLERELKLPNHSASAGSINELAACVEGGQTQLVVKFCEPVDTAVVCELWYAAHLAAYRIELLAGGGVPLDRPGARIIERSPVMGGLIGESELMQRLRKEIEIAAGLDLSVLITGEPGTGKELVACGIHKSSRRAGKPFVDVNCAAINTSLIESELFGHERWAFTGAQGRKIGYFEEANGGTLFLDEIGDMPLENQPKLLRVLQERKLKRVGGTEAIKIDIRLVAATNKDLHRGIEEGRFRRDLYDRLRGYPIRTPSLRERPTDIPILIRHYCPFVEFREDALELLCYYDWPGNVRELILMVERLAARAGSRRIVTADLARCEIDAEQKPALAPGNTECFPRLREGETLTEWVCRGVLATYERERAISGSHSAAGRRLRTHRNTLAGWLAWARRHGAKSTTMPNR
jgi:transcriptional regulator with GAF, ATPase, and Fis domain